MRVPEDGELEFDPEDVGQGNGVEAEGALERGRDACVGEWADGVHRVRGGRRAEGVGGAGGARRAHNLCVIASRRE